MNLLSVAPLADGIPHEELSYFSKEDIQPGDLVEVSVRKRNIKGLVLAVSSVREEKQELRQSLFGLKKISKLLSKNYIHPVIMQALQDASSYHIFPLGKMIYDLLPEKLFQAAKIPPLCEQKAKPGFDMLLLQHTYDDRVTRYKSVIRESFAKKQSIVMYFPTITDLTHALNYLSRGIDEYVIPFHSALTEKEWNTSYKKLIEEEHPVVILTTPSLLPYVRSDVGTIIIEREHSHYYYGHNESYDIKDVLIRIAKTLRTKLILGSHLLSLSTYLLFEEREAVELMPLQYRNDTPIEVISMQGEQKTASPHFSKQALEILHKLHTEKRGHVFLYAHRKGMYPTTVCSDCGTLFSCENCNRPYVLHKISGLRTFVCHSCEHIIQLQEDTTVTCRKCGSWHLSTLGVATGGIEEELKILGIPYFCIDGEHTATRAKIKKTYDAWKDSAYGVLIGTEMAHNSTIDADTTIVLSLDSLFSLPEYRTDEKILHLITEMAERVKEGSSVYVQTRLPKMPVMKYLMVHSFAEFYRDTLKERKELHLPPHYVVIKAVFHNVNTEMKTLLERECSAYEPLWYEAGGGKTLLFIHVPRHEWTESLELRYKVRAILSGVEVRVNPLHFFIA